MTQLREDTFATRQALLDYAKRYVQQRDMPWETYYRTITQKVLTAPERGNNGRDEESTD